MANVFLFLESTQNAVLHQLVLNKSSLNWRPWILMHWCSLSVVVHDIENNFRCNGSNFLSYRLLQSFQSLSKVWHPTVNRFLIRTASRRPSAKRMRNARCVATGDPPFFINSWTIKARCSAKHAMVYTENGTYAAVRRRAPHHCTRSPPEAMTPPNRGVLFAAPCISVLYFVSLYHLYLPLYLPIACINAFCMFLVLIFSSICFSYHAVNKHFSC